MKSVFLILTVILLLGACSREKVNSDNIESYLSSIIKNNIDYLRGDIKYYRDMLSDCHNSDNRICFLVSKEKCSGDNLCFALIYSTMEAEKDLKTYRIADSLYIAFEDQYKNDTLRDANRDYCCSESILYESSIWIITTPSMDKYRMVYCGDACDADNIIQFQDFPNENDNNDFVIEVAQIDETIESCFENESIGEDFDELDKR